jgi:hypothetical protein
MKPSTLPMPAAEINQAHLGDTKTPNQEEALFNKIVALSIKYPKCCHCGA